jgi:hypothetical protein
LFLIAKKPDFRLKVAISQTKQTFMSNNSSPQRLGLEETKVAQLTKSLNQMELTASKTLELGCDFNSFFRRRIVKFL